MSIPSISYEEITQQLDHYVQECARIAADTTHGYKKNEAALRADGAVRLWIALFGAKLVEDDLVRLRKMVQNISTTDEQ